MCQQLTSMLSCMEENLIKVIKKRIHEISDKVLAPPELQSFLNFLFCFPNVKCLAIFHFDTYFVCAICKYFQIKFKYYWAIDSKDFLTFSL